MSQPACLLGAGYVISVTQTDQHWLLAPGGENPSETEGGKDDADLVTVGLDCYHITSFFFVTCGSDYITAGIFLWIMKKKKKVLNDFC